LLPAPLIGALLHGPHAKGIGLGRRAIAGIGDGNRRDRFGSVVHFFLACCGCARSFRMALPNQSGRSVIWESKTFLGTSRQNAKIASANAWNCASLTFRCEWSRNFVSEKAPPEPWNGSSRYS